METLKDAITPHRLELRRYDYVKHLVSGKWEAYQDLRATVRLNDNMGDEYEVLLSLTTKSQCLCYSQGRYAPDPRLERSVFVEACRLGDLSTVKDKLVRGADPNYMDDTDCELSA